MIDQIYFRATSATDLIGTNLVTDPLVAFCTTTKFIQVDSIALVVILSESGAEIRPMAAMHLCLSI